MTEACPCPTVPKVSIILPVFNEADGLTALHQRLTAVMDELHHTYELLFVDDGSEDGSYATLCALHQQDPHVRVLKLSRNFGHHLAITAGIDHATGELLVLMDADLQDLPEELPKLFAHLSEEVDVVYALRKHKKFSAWRRLSAAAFRWWMRRFGGFALEGGIFQLMRRPVAEALKQCRERHRYIVGLIRWVGFRQVAVEVEHGARLTGKSKYHLAHQLRLGFDALLSFSNTPLKLLFWLGWMLTLPGLAGALWWLNTAALPQTAPPLGGLLLSLGSFFSGLNLLGLGLLGTYLQRLLDETRSRPLYIVDHHRSIL